LAASLAIASVAPILPQVFRIIFYIVYFPNKLYYNGWQNCANARGVVGHTNGDIVKEIDFNNLSNEIVDLLHGISEITVATCDSNKVTARTVYCISDNINLYFITSSAYIKYKQLSKNPNIALAINNIQIEGIAENLGHPLEEQNKFFHELCKKNDIYLKYFNSYLKYKNTILFKVNPKLITLYKGKGLYNYLNLEQNKAYKKGKK
jgi:uncharacterized pyridoxamine 5'-phosphate oxidase family protein